MKRAKLKGNIEHQGIGGKEITIEKEMTGSYILDRDFKDMTIAEYNFIKRRPDLISMDEQQFDNMKIYYGHVGLLGYFVAEDEIEEEL